MELTSLPQTAAKGTRGHTREQSQERGKARHRLAEAGPSLEIVSCLLPRLDPCIFHGHERGKLL